MFETLKQKFTGEETMRREDPPREDKRAASAEEMNSDDLATGGAVPGESDEDLRTVWGSRTGPDTLPSGADATVTSVSASSAQLLSHGGRFGSAYCKVMYVPRDGWPANPEAGLLDRLTAHSSAGVQVKLRVEPMDRQRAASEFKRRLRNKRKELYAKRQAGAPDAGVVEDEVRELEATLRAIEAGVESIYWVGVYFVVRARTKGDVDDAGDEIKYDLAKDELDVSTLDWVPTEGMTTVSPIGKRELPDRTLTAMTGSALRCLFPFSTASMIEESGVLYGYHGLNGSPITVDRFNRTNGYNQLVVGNIGAGKSYGMKLLLLRRLVRDRDVSGVIVDPRGEFRELIDTLGIDAETVEVGGTKGINPLQIEPTPQDVLDERSDMDPRSERVKSALSFFEAVFADSDGNSSLDPMDQAILSEAITDAYTEAGITEDPATHSRDSPIIEDVYRILGRYGSDTEGALGEDAPAAEIETWETKAANLRIGLRPFRGAGQYSHLNQPTNIGLGKDGSRVVLLNIEGSEGGDDLPLSLKLAFDAIYEQAKQPGRMIAAFDEAHKVMNNPGGLDWLVRATRYSRHFQLSLTLMSQTAEDFFYTTDDEGKTHVNTKAKTIADNCTLKWLFRTRGLTTDLGEMLGISERETRFVADATPGDRKRGWSHSLLSVDDLGTAPVRVEAINDTEEHSIDPPEPTPDGENENEESADGLGGTVATDGGQR